MPDIVPVKRSESRVFVTQWGSGPANVPEYFGHAAANSLGIPSGDVTRHSIPSDTAYSQFETIAQTRGARDNATFALQVRYPHQISRMRELQAIGCPLDMQVHIGQCRDPKDVNGGWDLIEVLELARIENIDIDQLGALQEDDEELVMEEPTLAVDEPYQLKNMAFAERAGSVVENEVIAVQVCDAVECGDCDDPSDGTEDILALQLASGGSPGILAEIAYSSDKGGTWAGTLIDTLAANEEPNDMACVGANTVVVSDDSLSQHYAPTADILAAAETWTEVATGYVAASGPRAIWSLSPSEVYIVGTGGYIYRSTDITSGVTVLDAGVATTQNLEDVMAPTSNVIIAVGALNAVVYSTDGGVTWQSITGPSVGVTLNVVWALSERVWFIGDAGGQLWFTLDQGATWTEKLFPGSGAGQVRDVVFATPTVGWMAHDTATPAGRILRTIDGGNSWYVLPEQSGSIPANDRINALGVAHGAPKILSANLVYGGGLDDAGTDGIIVKAA